MKGGTIMSYCTFSPYGIDFANGFGKQPGDLIRKYMSEADCLPKCTPILTDLEPPIATQNIKIYPNPTSDFVTIQLDMKKVQKVSFQVINILGQLVHKEAFFIAKENIIFDVRSFPAGTYILKFLINDKVLVNKVLVKI
jgi:hypothetical protein